MNDGLACLTEMGFKLAALWNVAGERIAYDLNEFGNSRNVLSAFAADGEVMFVGRHNR